MSDASECPFTGANTTKGTSATEQWWPEQLNLKILHQHDRKSNPMDPDFDYAAEFNSLDFGALKADVASAINDSQEWWPADWGHYGGLMVRLTWHAAGTYRVADGRGGAGTGAQRFAPLNSWPDNGNLDKARRVLWPVKQKYGKAISWADLLVLAGNVAYEAMGLKTFGFGGGREDIWGPEEDIYWGKEVEWLTDHRYTGDRELETPLGAVLMGLIYVFPGGPNGVPDPALAAHDIRETFARMAMNDEETVALIAGGHSVGRGHGAAPDSNVGPEPEGAALEDQGFGWKNMHGSGMGNDTITSGFDAVWTTTPFKWSHDFFRLLFKYEWEVAESPAGVNRMVPIDLQDEDLVPNAHNEGETESPIYLVTDVALKADPEYAKISQRFMENHEEFEDAFARAWFKLLHRDMGPKARYLGPEVPAEDLIWQDPIPAGAELSDDQVASLKTAILGSGLTVQQLVATAWASASSFRGTDLRGGANGARIALAPMKDWAINQASGVAEVIAKLDEVRAGSGASLADTIVLGGVAAIEKAAADAGHSVSVPFTSGRGDATQEMTEVDSINYLETTADGFRNYIADFHKRPFEELLVDKAFLLNLTAPEMTALVGGMRALDANAGGAQHGVLTDRPGQLTNDFFVNLLSMDTEWSVSTNDAGVYDGKNRATGDVTYTATGADLVFGSNSQLRAIAEVYGCSDGEEKFVSDFIAAWTKVMELDLF